ncbi:unnamed protein product [Pylaiella littoralis]
MRCDGHQAGDSADADADADADALEEDLRRGGRGCIGTTDYYMEHAETDRAAASSRDRSSSKTSLGGWWRTRRWLGWGWVVDARTSLRGRRLFTLFAVVNLLNYLDRGVIPGGSEEYDAFIQQRLHTQEPDVYLGILQSGFILGFSTACVVFARLARHRSPFSLMGVGLGVWCGAAVLAGLAKPLGSYTVLLVARLLSGVGEASFVTVVPPLITETAPPGERGLWLSLFYTAQPVGAGIGYVYGSTMATSRLGWPWAFYIEALLMAPLALTCALVPHDNATTVENASDYGTLPGSGSCVTVGNNTEPLLGSKEYGSRTSLGMRQEEAAADPSSLVVPVPSMSSPPQGKLRSRRRRSDNGEPSGGGRGEGQRRGEGEDGLHSSSSSLSGLSRHGGGREEGAEEEPTTDRQKQHASEVRSRGYLVMSPPPRGVVSSRGGSEQGWAGSVAPAAAVSSVGSLNDGGESALPASPDLFDEDLRASSAAPGGGGGGERSILVRDVLSVTDRCVFCLVVLGVAASAAVTSGMSTFGTGFVISLEFLSSETAAAATFGGVICAAGLAGTPAGGALIDSADPEGRLGDDEKLAMVLMQATALMCGATALLVAATLQSSLVPFLFFFFCGGGLLFATASHSNLAVMLASPRHLRPLALAVNSIMLHALGDVPSPTVIGWMKDALAPHCVAGGTGVGEASRSAAAAGTAAGSARGSLGSEVDVDGGWVEEGLEPAAAWGGYGGGGVLIGISDACRSERRGLHLTLVVIACWLLWTCLFFGLARAVQASALEHGVVPASWSDIKGLIWKGLFRPSWTKRRPCRRRCRRAGLVTLPARSRSRPPKPSSWPSGGWWRPRRERTKPRPSTLLSINDDSSSDDGDGGDDCGVGSILEEPLLPSSSSSSSS